MPDDDPPRSAAPVADVPATPVAPAAPKTDIALLCGPAPSGDGVAVLRLRDGKVAAGVLHPLREGVPLTAGEVVKLHPRDDNPRVCDVTVEHVVAPPTRAMAGPAQVATTAYRSNWDQIFGAKTPRDVN